MSNVLHAAQSELNETAVVLFVKIAVQRVDARKQEIIIKKTGF